MAWVSPKVYAILKSSEEGKDILEGIAGKDQAEVDKEVDAFFGKGGKGYSKNADYQKAKEEHGDGEDDELEDRWVSESLMEEYPEEIKARLKKIWNNIQSHKRAFGEDKMSPKQKEDEQYLLKRYGRDFFEEPTKKDDEEPKDDEGLSEEQIKKTDHIVDYFKAWGTPSRGELQDVVNFYGLTKPMASRVFKLLGIDEEDTKNLKYKEE